MTEESQDTKIAILNERVTGIIADRKTLRSEIAELKAQVSRIALERSQSSEQRDRNIRWLAYILAAAVATNIAGPEAAASLLTTLIGAK